MPYAIALSARNASQDSILRLWEEATAFEDSPSMTAQNYPPHLTLAIYDDIPPERLEELARTVASGRAPMRLMFDAVKYFDNPTLVLWASPENTSDLVHLHRQIHDRIDPQNCNEHYRPETWVPHCTLAANVAQSLRKKAIDFAMRPIGPFEVVFDTVDWVRFPPVKVSGSVPLKIHSP